MSLTLAALLFRPDEVSERALSHGFAVSLAGWDVSAPHLATAPLRALPGWSVAFYRSGEAKRHGAAADFEHACELFEDELPPGLAVRDAAAEATHTEPVVYGLLYTEDALLDDAWRFSADGVVRRFVRDGDESIEAGVLTHEEGEIEPVEIDVPEGATEKEEADLIDGAVLPRRGTTFLSEALGAAVLPCLAEALFMADALIPILLVDPSPASIAAEVSALNRVLGRVDGRATFEPPPAAGVEPPASYRAFVGTYDFADPSDPGDQYRELAIGAIEGTLRFLRELDLASAKAVDGYPIAKLTPSALGGARPGAILVLAPDGERLLLVADGKAQPAGPTLGELVAYLRLGWTRNRNGAEEDFLDAVMLRARVAQSR